MEIPALNATLNATSAVCVVAGLVCIRRRWIAAHTVAMLAACAVSTLFLVSYVAYHLHAGHIRFHGQGALRTLYLVILASHTILAIVTVPLVLRTVSFAMKRRFPEHTRLAHVTAPVWLYVSVTGVIVYIMLYRMS